MDTLVIGKVFSASVLGLFYKAQSLNQLVVQYAFSSFAGVLFPSFSKMGEDKERLRAAMLRILNLVCFTTFLFSGLMYINAEAIIVILLTEKWIGSVPIFKLLAVFSFIYTLPTILVSPILSLGKSGAILKVEVAKKMLYLFAIPAAIYLGLYAYISSTILAAVAGMGINLYLINYYFGYKPTSFIRLFLKYFFPFVLLLVIDYFTPVLINNNFISIIFKSIIYFILYIGYNKIRGNLGYIEFNNVLSLLLEKIKNKRN
jgi:O-antigen/teichoic acid export membrane protein